MKAAARKTRRQAEEEGRDAHAPIDSGNAAWIDQRTRGFDRSLRNLGIPEMQEIVAQLERFLHAWKRGAAVGELREDWDYKPIMGGDAKKYGVMQIKPARNYRVLLTTTRGSPPCVWFLEVHRRGNTKVDDQHRDTAIQRAKEIHTQVGK